MGEALSKTFAIFFKSFPKIIGLAIVVYSPYIAIQLTMPGAVDPETGIQATNRLGAFLGFFLGPIVTAAVTYEVLQRMRGQTASFSDCLSTGFSRLFPVLLVNMLMILAIGVGSVFAILGIVMMTQNPWVGLLMLVAGIIPGIYFAVMLCVAIPVCVVERPGIIASLDRSSELTKGSRWGIFGALLVFGALYFLLFIVLVGVVLAGVASDSATLVVIFTIAVTIVMSALQAVLMATIYHELRTKKEGAASDDLVNVFA